MTEFSNPEEWRLNLYQQNSANVADTHAGITTTAEVGYFLIDLRDNVGRALAKSLIKELDTDQNTIIISVQTERYLKLLNVLENQRETGFQHGQLIYDKDVETPVCVIAANGSTFIVIKR